MHNPLRLTIAGARNEALSNRERQWTPLDPRAGMMTAGGVPLAWAYLRRCNGARGTAALYFAFDLRGLRERARLRRILKSQQRATSSLFSWLPRELIEVIVSFLPGL